MHIYIKIWLFDFIAYLEQLFQVIIIKLRLV